ncbi:septum site-determining protein MinC [Sporolactobacillus shoreicorticis]|uniref:Probable septum site-determining protein MinC n=1 Tax=Sporolactobacillus shoreicorticis TaxID=1923877 RepID=A0ABW5RZX6_9BACL|nr:septum site-determining protein MinC [Sporolactobacillus shoreicorticis]MCO7127949.1 septum site-determining protein MinC [Sporolactobacillus shoreicorticis]
MSATQPLITMKGRKDGLVLVMDEACAYRDLVRELKEKLAANTNLYKEGPVISVKIQAGNRYISAAQRDQLKEIIHSFDHLKVDDIQSNVITLEDIAKKKAQEKIVPIARIIRSGQVLSIEGDLLLIGDVNPGGTVSATGNIYIFGALRGVAAAGSADDRKSAVIVASIMKPTQLKIGQVISRNENNTIDEMKEDHLLECAYLDEKIGKIVIDRVHAALKKRNLSFALEKL